MTILTPEQFYTIYMPAYCGVHPSYGVISKLVFDSEEAGEKAFAADKFKDARERGKMLIPFYIAGNVKHELCLDVIEMAILRSYQIKKGEDHTERIEELENSSLTSEMLEVGTLDWWNQAA